MPSKISIEDFLKRLEERNKKYNSIFLNDIQSFASMHKKAEFRCEKDHVFASISKNVMDGHGCPICTKKIKYSEESLRSRLADTEYMFVDFSEYNTNKSKMRFKCKEGHTFNAQLTAVLLNKHGCSRCSGKYRITKKNVSAEVISRTSGKYECINPEDFVHREGHNLIFKCKRDHTFSNSYKAICIDGTLCPLCYPSNASKKALDWLQSIRNRDGTPIRDHHHGGEYGIPTTNYRADGYCEETKTIYEFYGTNFHGDLKILDPESKPNPFLSDLTAKEMYDYTMQREAKILELGYNLVSIWEREWDELVCDQRY